MDKRLIRLSGWQRAPTCVAGRLLSSEWYKRVLALESFSSKVLKQSHREREKGKEVERETHTHAKAHKHTITHKSTHTDETSENSSRRRDEKTVCAQRWMKEKMCDWSVCVCLFTVGVNL